MPDDLQPRCIAFGLSPILEALREQEMVVEEISLDSTFGTNAQQMELYALVLDTGEGIPACYMFLEKGTTALDISSSPFQKTYAVRSFLSAAKDVFSLDPKVIHIDKDAAEILACRDVYA
ncbi:hypothetical protein L202_02500 [Cryptococcus amylolentus CBS 6039]|uniref:MULE transposase domain-containing protein n=2 Tax=Cryptococcus amylolentus TaxID=104669 RepID=A0A1E3I2X6_9TREE|nr:hypothetical protein L202_02500 [Cryptococcus amylolentus CBS 6039]ODN82211.1 hypothetical protein L202_02500 [Cryptococcus amylolentus CBS 6039]ODO09705.1 hypothetical protein I350_01919 [Cryptococcus amylolentus CBS 6273]